MTRAEDTTDQSLPGRLARRLRAGQAQYVGWNPIGEPLITEAMARAGYDAVLMDMQHGFHTTDSVLRGAGALSLADTPALVRIPVGRFDMASRALDFGAQAVVAPMINSGSDAAAFAAAMKYPPAGDRSWGPARALTLLGYNSMDQYLRSANADTLAIAMVETRQAVAALDDILLCEGIDGAFVGPSDFSIAWSGGERVDAQSADMMPAIEDICRRTLEAGKIPGVFAVTAGMAKKYADMGFRMIAVGSDGPLLTAAAKATLDEVRG